MNGIRVMRGAATQVGMKWSDGFEPMPALVYEPIIREVRVPHTAANIQCDAIIGERKDFESGVTYRLRCKKRSGHEFAKGEKRHKAADVRIVAAVPRTSRANRFAPSGIPGGVDLSITLPHNCDNHLDITNEVLKRGW
jgi:hypothetical protein